MSNQYALFCPRCRSRGVTRFASEANKEHGVFSISCNDCDFEIKQNYLYVGNDRDKYATMRCVEKEWETRCAIRGNSPKAP